MKTIIALIFVLFSYAALFSQCADTTNIYTFTYNGTTYEVVKESKTWADAAACAVERNGYLAEIGDLSEQNGIYDAIINGAGVSPTYTSVANGGGIAYVWIGATDQQTEGTWLWDGNDDNSGIHFWTGEGDNGANNGVAVGGAYYNWGGTSSNSPHEPDNYGSGQHHAAIALAGWPSGTTMLGVAGEWNDIIGSSLIYFVIEKNNTTGIQGDRAGNTEDIRVFPNPTNGSLIIDTDYQVLEVCDANGKLLRQFSSQQEIDISGLEDNIYFLRIKGEDGAVRMKKVILN